jgi:hypothetical protein
MAQDVGTGATMTFGTSSYSADILSISGGEASVPVVDTTHMGTTNSRTAMFGDLVTEGEIEVQIAFDPDEPPPLGTSETVTLTFPIPSGSMNGATFSGTGGISKRTYEVPLEDRITGTYTVSWLDEVTHAVAS